MSRSVVKIVLCCVCCACVSVFSERAEAEKQARAERQAQIRELLAELGELTKKTTCMQLQGYHLHLCLNGLLACLEHDKQPLLQAWCCAVPPVVITGSSACGLSHPNLQSCGWYIVL